MSLQKYFSEVADFRMMGKCLHKLSDILIIGLFTYLSNGEDYEDMVLFAKTHSEFLSDYADLPNGIPSHDTFNRVFSCLHPDILRRCLTEHGRDILDVLCEKQICFDGKKLKGVSPTSRGNKGLFIVNAWVAENRLCIGQKRVDEKSNELTAIPDLISEIDIKDAVVSIDAIGCQGNIARQIVSAGGHYLLALKKNQQELLDDVICGFKACRTDLVNEEWEYDHGRFEPRTCSVLSAPKALMDENLIQWAGLKTLVRIEARRLVKDKKQTETRYYISDEAEQSPAYFNALTRGHWGIENQLHWHLDITFKEDACRVRTGYAPENLSTMRKLALQVIKDADGKLSLKKRRVKAAYDTNYLKKLIT